MKENTYMRIGDLSKKSGVSKQMIHFYLKEKILPAPLKTSKTMSYYNDRHLKRLIDIQLLRMRKQNSTKFLKKHFDESNSHQKEGSANQDNCSDELASFQHPNIIKKKQITQAGIKIFSQKGYYKTRVQDITDDIGVSTGSFYKHFENKQDLFMNVVNDVLRTLVGDTAAAIKQEKDYIKKLYLRGKTFFNNYSKYFEILSILRREVSSDEKWAIEIIRKIHLELSQPLIQETTQAIKDGILKDIDAELFAYHLIGLIDIMTFRSTFDEKYDFETIWKHIEQMLQGLRK